MPRTYHVVFEGKGLKGTNYAGIRTWASFESKAEFDACMEEWVSDTGVCDSVIAQGVSEDEARRLVRQTTGQARALAALKQIEENPEAAGMYLSNALLAAQHDGTEAKFRMELAKHGIILE